MTRENSKFSAAVNMLFLFLLALSSFANSLSRLLYYLAFILPIALALAYMASTRSDGECQAKIDKEKLRALKGDLTISKKSLLLSLPLIFPAITLTLLFSVLTSLVLGALGYENAMSFDSPFYLSVVTHALVPAVLEELLFRFVPIRLLGKGRAAILISALCFAASHVNLFQIPYAFAAGIMLSVVYVMTGSVIMPIVVHFLNNLISLISIYGYIDGLLVPIILSLCAVSVVFIVVMRKEYARAEYPKKEEGAVIYPYPFIFAGLALFIAVTSL